MKKFIQLGMLTALACVSAQATTVTWNSTVIIPTSSISATSGSESVAATGYVSFNGSYSLMSVQSNGSGVGVDSSAAGPLTNGQSSSTVDGAQAEYLVLNFSNTLTGQVAVDSIVMNFSSGPSGAGYFRYAWSANAPTTLIADGSFTTVTSLNNQTQNPYSFGPLSGTGRYLVINPLTTNSLQVASVTFTSVPDGASTLALMGAALATLGFAARRRKA